MRILPLGQWISNRIRFLFRGLYLQRGSMPLVNNTFHCFFPLLGLAYKRTFVRGKCFRETFHFLYQKMRRSPWAFFLGSLFLHEPLPWKIQAPWNPRIRWISPLRLRNHSISPQALLEKLENTTTDQVLLLNTNPRLESPLFHLRLRETSLDFFSLGSYHYDFPCTTFGNSSRSWKDLLQGKTSLNPRNCVILNQNYHFTLDLPRGYRQYSLLPTWVSHSLLSYQTYGLRSPEEVSLDHLPFFLDCPDDFRWQGPFSVVLATHLPKEMQANGIFLPHAGYLESSFSFLDGQGKYQRASPLKPSYNAGDLLSSLFLYYHKSRRSARLRKKAPGSLRSMPRPDSFLFGPTGPSALEYFSSHRLPARNFLRSFLFTQQVADLYRREPLSRQSHL